jgi:hypothetical protein
VKLGKLRHDTVIVVSVYEFWPDHGLWEYGSDWWVHAHVGWVQPVEKFVLREVVIPDVHVSNAHAIFFESW